MKRALLILALYAVCALRCEAQFIGYVAPQTVQQTLANATVCTGAVQNLAIQNLGQTQHYLTATFAGGYTKAQAEIDGVDANANVVRISDILTPTSVGGTSVVSAAGYWTKLQVAVVCSAGATFNASYQGAWGTSSVSAGGYLIGQIDKILWSSIPGTSAPSSNVIATPFGSTAGTVYFGFGAASGAGTLTVSCYAPSSQFSWSYPVVSVLTTQAFVVPAFNCLSVTAAYSGAGGGNTQAEYVFSQPGTTPPAYQYSHISGTTATTVKGVTGFVHTLAINLGAAGTVSLFDLPAASCSGTPATNQVAIVTATATTLQTFTYDVNFLQGICVKASVGMDLTVSFQ